MPVSRWKEKPPTSAQARKLASIWGGGGFFDVPDFPGCHTDQTIAVLIRKNWITPTGARGVYTASHREFAIHRISPAGISALGTFFLDLAHREGK